MLKRIFAATLLVTLFSGCFKEPESVCNSYDPCAYKAPANEISSIQSYLSSNSDTAIQHCSGVFYKIQNAGTGSSPNICSQIAVRYKGMLTNGNVFDEQTTTPAVFNLGGLIPGWQSTLPLLKEGGRITLYVPPSLGYGSQDVRDNSGNIIIPANSILIFEVELVGVY